MTTLMGGEEEERGRERLKGAQEGD